jgi:hypothetical protein
MTVCSQVTVAQELTKKEIKQQERQKAFELTKELILSQKFQFEGDWMYSASGRGVNLDNRGNTLIIQGNKAEADLAFIGEARNASPSSSPQIIFNNDMESCDIDENSKKLKFFVKFKVKSDDDSYDLSLDIDSEGFTTLIVSSFRKSVMRYTGKVKPLTSNE